MSHMTYAMLLATSAVGYELPTFGAGRSVSYNWTANAQSGGYEYTLDICNSNPAKLILTITRDNSVYSTSEVILTTPSGFDKTKYTCDIVNVTGASGLTFSGTTTGAASRVVRWTGAYNTSSLSSSVSVVLRFSRIENPNKWSEVTLNYQFTKTTYVNPETANGGNIGLQVWIGSLGDRASMSLTFLADRTAVGRAVYSGSDTDAQNSHNWLSANYNPSNYEARLEHINGMDQNQSWSDLPGTISWSGNPATASTSQTSNSYSVTVRNKITGSTTSVTVTDSLAGPNVSALVYPTLTFPTNTHVNEFGWSWSFSFGSDGMYSSTYSTPDGPGGSFTATGRWLRKGYPASNYRFQNGSGSVTGGSGTTGFSGSFSGAGNISTGGGSFSASGSTGTRASNGFCGRATMGVTITNVASSATAGSPGVNLDITKN